MDYDFRAAVEALTALQKRLTFNGHRIAEAYPAPPDQGYGIEAMPAWLNSNPALADIDAMAGAVLYTVSVDSNLFLREKGASAATWEALGWWTAWLDLFHTDVQLGGACVSARIRPARDGRAGRPVDAERRRIHRPGDAPRNRPRAVPACRLTNTKPPLPPPGWGGFVRYIRQDA